MDDSILISQLPPNTRLPAALAALTAYSRLVGSDHLTDSTRLADDGPLNLAAWTRAAPSLADRLWIFAKDDTHALFALWRLDDRDLSACPVVRLDSEGVENRVVGRDLADFAWKLAAGRIDGTRGSRRLADYLKGRVDPPSPGAEDPAADERLNAWIRAGIAETQRDGSR